MKVKSLLVSQPAPAIAEKSPYHEIHTKYGVKVCYRPFIRVEGVSLKEYRSQRTEILDFTAVIFTSRTTIDNFFRICEEARITVPETMKYICNTEAVALYLQKYIVYRKRKISFANGTFSDFMELILKYKSEKILLTLSEPHKPEIPMTMEKLKLNFGKIILSKTVSSDLSDLDLHGYDMLAFFSPSEIASLIEQFGTDDLPMIATFGDGTTRAAISAGLTVNVMAPTPEAPSMAKAIDNFLRSIGSGQEVEPVRLSERKQSDEFLRAREAKQKKGRVTRPESDMESAAKSTNGSSNGNINGATLKTDVKETGILKKPAAKGIEKHVIAK